MNPMPIIYPNNNTQPIKYIFCPTGNCLNVPEINYTNNPLKNEFHFKCVCQKNNNNNEMNLNEFLYKSSQLNCHACMRKLIDGQIIYCIECKVVFDVFCVENHHQTTNHSHYIQLNKNIFNYCLEHKTPLMFRCMDCKKSLCNNCNLPAHDEKGHELEQLKKFAFNKNDIDKITNTFMKQKIFFEKIKEINNNLIQTLENDIKIKERIINNYLTNKSDYNSIFNLKNICIQNNEKYEKLLEDTLLPKNANIKSGNKEAEISNYINNYLSTLYYSLMINKEELINNSLISDLEKKVMNLNPPNIKPNNIQINVNNQMLEENINNYNNLENSKKNSNSNISINPNNNIANIIPNNPNNYFPQVSALSNASTQKNLNNQEFSKGNLEEKNKDIIDQQNNSNKKPFNANIRKIRNINNLTSSIIKEKTDSPQTKRLGIKNNSPRNSRISRTISKISSKGKIGFKSIKKYKTISNKKIKWKELSKIQIKTESNKSSDTQEIYSEESSKNGNRARKYSNYINNMIVLKSGNVAVSIREAVEIYNLSNLNFSGIDCYYNNEIMQNNCLLQRINLVKGRKISYVYELFDETLLCATYAKIFRIKLKNHDSTHEIMSYIKIETSELPTKIISLGKEFLVILTEQKINCNIKILKKIDNQAQDQQKQNILKESQNKINNENNQGINNSKNKDENNCGDVPAIGNVGLFVSKDIEEDTSYELTNKNINEIKKLWVSIHPIEKKSENKANNQNNQKEHYLYEFIATSNATYDLGRDKVAFFGLMKNKKEKYCVKKIKEISGLSCSAEADSIYQIKDKYICVGLQNHNLNGQMSGFAFIDINYKNVVRIIKDQEISCVYYNAKYNLLFASMEVRDPNKNYFSAKIYEIIQNRGDKGNEDIELNMIYNYKSKHTDIICSIQPMPENYMKGNYNEEDISNHVIFVSASKDSTLEVVKAKFD